MPKPLELYEELKAKLGEKEAKDLVEFVQESIEKGAASKEDVRRSEATLRTEMSALREDMRKIEASLKEDIRRLQAELHKEISALQRWLFGFWITIIVAILCKEFLR